MRSATTAAVSTGKRKCFQALRLIEFVRSDKKSCCGLLLLANDDDMMSFEVLVCHRLLAGSENVSCHNTLEAFKRRQRRMCPTEDDPYEYNSQLHSYCITTSQRRYVRVSKCIQLRHLENRHFKEL